MQPRVVFMGTPEFAVPSLRELARHLGSAGLLVVTQPDRAAGRGRRLQPPPVKVNAEELGLDVIQVHTLKDPSVRERLVAHSPDLIVVAAFGRILPAWVLNLPPRGCVNLHASLLPRFRGASPIAAAVACGDDRTGVA
ncbi:MAG: methionyl-tRNA formyltransferase, partial [Chloroflexota bacterium]|nr:methionyl-tRNA formyltransferase [Chloroflexota bacterium]